MVTVEQLHAAADEILSGPPEGLPLEAIEQFLQEATWTDEGTDLERQADDLSLALGIAIGFIVGREHERTT